MALTLLSPVSDIYRRDVDVDAAGLVDPTDASVLVAGEWVHLNASGQAEDANYNTLSLFQVFTEKGDYSAQALGKVTILSSYDYRAETDQHTGTIAVGAYLKVSSTGLLEATTGAGDIIVAVAQSAVSGGAGTLTYQRVSPFRY